MKIQVKVKTDCPIKRVGERWCTIRDGVRCHIATCADADANVFTPIPAHCPLRQEPITIELAEEKPE